MAGTITPEGAEQLNGLMAMMPDANVAGMGLDQFCPYYIDKLSASYNMGFAVACISLVVSMAIYFATKRRWFKHADVNAKQAKTSGGNYVELTPKQTKERIIDAMPRVCCGYLLLDGVPPERTVTDLVRP